MMMIKIVFGATKSKPHGHMGLLEPYDGQLLPVKVTADQSAKLEKGLPVTYNERVGRSGRGKNHFAIPLYSLQRDVMFNIATGVVIQDINASEPICMEKIRDLLSYPKMVPNVKSVNVYDIIKFPNGTSQTRAEFRVGALGLRFGYYLLLTHEPKYKTLTWTLDYKFNSDFDDNVGHWQVMPHPTKKYVSDNNISHLQPITLFVCSNFGRGWSRVLFSTKVKLFAWIPGVSLVYVKSTLP